MTYAADGRTNLERMLAGDPYFAEGGSMSVLALPIRRNEARLGVVYLENKLATRAFTRDRVHVLHRGDSRDLG